MGEFDVLPSALPSAEAAEVIEQAQQAALEVEDTEEAWYEAFFTTWRDEEPETFNATCDLFTPGEKLVITELGPAGLAGCWSDFPSSRNEANFGAAADAIEELGVTVPFREGTDWYVDVQAWAVKAPQDLVSVCRALGYGRR